MRAWRSESELDGEVRDGDSDVKGWNEEREVWRSDTAAEKGSLCLEGDDFGVDRALAMTVDVQ